MPTITLKGIPARLHRDLKARAKAHQRSLNKEVIATLQDAASRTRPIPAVKLIREARAIRGKFSREVSAREIETWIQQGRR
jgi:plasmid stability protein